MDNMSYMEAVTAVAVKYTHGHLINEPFINPELFLKDLLFDKDNMNSLLTEQG